MSIFYRIGFLFIMLPMGQYYNANEIKIRKSHSPRLPNLKRCLDEFQLDKESLEGSHWSILTAKTTNNSFRNLQPLRWST